jgi:uncharacterized protein (TIGR03083 family)
MIKINKIEIVPLFPIERQKLLELLRNLSPDQWNKETICTGWSIKDIVQHLLKDDIGVISRKRDGYKIPNSSKMDFKSQEDFVTYINSANQAWVEISRTFSPKLLIDLLEQTGNWLNAYWETIDLDKVESRVSWIGEDLLPNWFNVAREYTERWLHQMQIREASDAPLLYDPELFHPLIQCYMLSLPLAYKDVLTDIGNKIKFTVEGDSGGTWELQRIEAEWCLSELEPIGPYQAEITIDQDSLWRHLSRGIQFDDLLTKVKSTGDQNLVKPFFKAISIIS